MTSLRSNTATEALKLTYPSFQPGQHLLVETRPSAIKKWLSSLPYGDITRVLDEITETLTNLNRCEIQVRDREAIASYFTKSYQRINHFYRRQDGKSVSLVTPEEMRKLGQLNQEMAFCYKIVVDGLSARKISLRKNQRVGTAINETINYLGLILMDYYENYAPIPIYVWREINALYQYAQEHGLAELRLHKNDDELGSRQRIEDTFVRTCLMSLINPYHLDKGEHWQTFKYLSHWCELITLSADLTMYQNNKCFVVDLLSSDKPTFITDEFDSTGDPALRLLLTDKLVQMVEQHIKRVGLSDNRVDIGFFSYITKPLALKLLKRIQSYAEFQIERTSPRYPVITKIDIVWGLGQISRVMQSRVFQSKSEDTQLMVEQVLGSKYPIAVKWDAVNFSRGGMCISHTVQDVNVLRVGELVALRRYINDTAESQVEFGLCRWLNSNGKQGSTVGVSFLEGTINMGMAAPKNRFGEVLTKQPIFQITPPEKGLDQQKSIIAPRGLFQSGQEVVLEVNGVDLTIRLDSSYESSAKIEIFHFHMMEDDLDELLNRDAEVNRSAEPGPARAAPDEIRSSSASPRRDQTDNTPPAAPALQEEPTQDQPTEDAELGGLSLEPMTKSESDEDKRAKSGKYSAMLAGLNLDDD